MKTILRTIIVALLMGTPAAFAQNTDSHPQENEITGAATHSTDPDQQTDGENVDPPSELDAKKKIFNEQFKAIIRKQVGTRNGLIGEYRKNKDNPEKLKEIQQALDDNELEAARSALALIETTDDDVSKIRVLLWGVRGLQENASKIMNKVLMEKYADSDEILPIRRVVLSRATPTHEAMIRQLIKDSNNRKVKGMMTFTLAIYLDSLKNMSELDRRMAVSSLGKDGTYITKRSEPELSNEIDQLLETCINDFDDVEVTQRKVSELAAGMKFATTELAIGKVVPEIEGSDLDGQPFKLSDYRGKVIVLDFWGDWCAACKLRYAYQRSLVDQLADKPFALIGVNSDKDLEQIRSVVKEKQLNYRSFWNGEKGFRGPLSTKWDVRGWPTTFIVDAQGVIRYRNLLGDNLDRAIEMLLAEMGEDVKITHQYKPEDEENNKKRVEQILAARAKAQAEREEAAAKAKADKQDKEKR